LLLEVVLEADQLAETKVVLVAEQVAILLAL
jgi:hypothetical protein